jgi:hypothetical protein
MNDLAAARYQCRYASQFLLIHKSPELSLQRGESGL